MVNGQLASDCRLFFCVFFGLNCKKELKITLFLHFFVSIY